MWDAEGDDLDQMAAQVRTPNPLTEVGREITKEEADASDYTSSGGYREELRATMDRYESESPAWRGFQRQQEDQIR